MRDNIQLSDDFEFDIGIYFVETCNIEREAVAQYHARRHLIFVLSRPTRIHSFRQNEDVHESKPFQTNRI